MLRALFTTFALFLLFMICAAQIIPIGGVGRGAGATGPWSLTSISQPALISGGCSPGCPAQTVTTPAAIGNLVVAFAYANNISTAVRLSAMSGLGNWAFPANCNALQTGGLVGDVSCGWTIVNSIAGCTTTCQVTPTLSSNTSNAVQFVFREYHLNVGTIGIEAVPTGVTSTACGGTTSPCNAPTATITGSSDLVISAMAAEGTACAPAAPFGNFVNPFGEGSADRINTVAGTGASFTQQLGAITCLGTNTNANAALVTVAFTNQGSTSISLLKQGPTSFNSINQTITYNFTIQNTGNTTLNGTFNITDAKIGNIAGCGGTNIFLPPGVSVMCSENYTTTANDFNNPPIVNTAQANIGALQSNPSTAMVPLSTGTSIGITDTPTSGLYGGAKCDGSTDDGAAIQKTLAYAQSNNIPTVTAPANVTCRTRTYLGCPRPGDTDNHCGPTGCGFGSTPSCGCLNWGTCNFHMPQGVTFKGGPGTVIDGDGKPVFDIGIHLASWKNANVAYKVNNVVFGNTSITLTNPGDANNFAAGNYIALFYWRGRNDQCAGFADATQTTGDNIECDVIPMQVAKISSIVGGQLNIGTDVIAKTWNNGDGNAAGSANCTAGVGMWCGKPEGGGSTYGPCSQCISASQCTQNGGNCTVNYPAGPTEIVVINITNQTYDNCIIDTMTIRGPDGVEDNESYGCGLSNVNVLYTSNCFNSRTDINSVEHNTFQNVLWDIGPGGTNCTGSNYDFFQRASGYNLFDGVTYGDAAGNYWGGYSSAEVGYNMTLRNSTFYINNVNGIGCDFEFTGANEHIGPNNNFIMLNNNGVCSNPGSANNATINDNSFEPGWANGILPASQNIRNVWDGNIIQCHGDSSYNCLAVNIADTQITNNTLNNLAGSSPTALITGLFGGPNNVVWSTNVFNFNGGLGTGNGINLNRTQTVNGMHIDGNSFNGAGGQAINVSVGNGNTSTNCSVMGNSNHANMSVTVAAPGCTVTGN